MGIVCSQAFKGIPQSCLSDNGILMPAGLWFTPLSEQFDTLAEAGDDDNWITKVVAGSMTMVHSVKEVENTTLEDTVHDTTSQDKIFLKRGKIGLKFSVYTTVDGHKALLTFNGNSGRMGVYDSANNVLGTSSDRVVFKGWKLSYIHVSDLIIPTDASPAYSVIEVQFADNSELNESLHVLRPLEGTAANKWYPADLPILSQIKIEQVGDITANVAVIRASVYAPSDSDNDGSQVATGAIGGLLAANTLATDGSGTTLTPTTVVESTTEDGLYTCTYSAIVAGADIQIVPSVLDTEVPSVLQPFYSDALTLT